MANLYDLVNVGYHREIIWRIELQLLVHARQSNRVNEIKIFDRFNVDYFLLLQTLCTSFLGINNGKE